MFKMLDFASTSELKTTRKHMHHTSHLGAYFNYMLEEVCRKTAVAHDQLSSRPMHPCCISILTDLDVMQTEFDDCIIRHAESAAVRWH